MARSTLRAVTIVCTAALLSAPALSATQPKTPREAALSALADAKKIYAMVCQASPQQDATVLPAAVEVRLGRAVVVASDILAKGDDRELATALVDYVAVSGCSSNRTPALAMARVFRARPDSIQSTIEAVPVAQRCNVVSQLDWGWHNDFLPAPTAAGVNADREARLKKLKAGMPAKCS